MSERLVQNITSDYFSAANRLAGKKKPRRRIFAYVESYDDIAFWRTLLDEAETDDYYFEVMLPSQSNLCKGKKQVLMNTLDEKALGNSLIACVDSDYDFLIQGATSVSDRINASPFIFQTYAYAIENYQCNAGSLHEVCVQSTLNDRHIFDFEEFYKQYSQICYPLFLWSVYFYRQCDTNTFPMHIFNNCTLLREIYTKDIERTLQPVKRSVEQKLNEMRHRFPSLQTAVDAMMPEMKRLGLEPDTTYLYMQGHHIMDDITLKLIQPVCATLRHEREVEIKRLAMHKEQEQNELTCYENSQIAPELMIRKNRDYKKLYLYKWVQQDLQDFKQLMEKPVSASH